MAIEVQETTTHKSQIRHTKKRSSQTNDELHFIVSPTFKSMTDIIIIDDEEEEITLEPKKKKQRLLGSWWNYDEVFNELSCVVKGSSKVSRVHSCFSSTDLHEKKTTKKKDATNSSLSPIHLDNFIDLSEEEIVGETTISSSNKGNGHVTLEELGVTVEDLKSMSWELFDPIWEIRSEIMDPWLGGYVKDIISS